MATARSGNDSRKLTAIRTPFTKTQLLAALAENTGVSKQDVAAVLDELSVLIHRHVTHRGAGQFTLPGLLKINAVKKAATKARKGRNPFTGEELMFKAKPARTALKVQPLKGLKSMLD